MSDARIEEIRVTNRAHKGAIAWLLRDGADNDIDAGILHRHILLEEVDRLSARVVKMTTPAAAHVEERDQLREQLAEARRDRSSPDMVKWAQEEATKSERERRVEVLNELLLRGQLGGVTICGGVWEQGVRDALAAIDTP